MRYKVVKLYWLLFGILGMLVGCSRSGSVPAFTVAEHVELPPPNANIEFATTQPNLNPVVISTVPAPQNAPHSLALPTVPPVTSTPMPATPLPTHPPPTATLPPTFTPPALPFTSNNEHYWLWRPVADGGIVWTNKSYPYGSTRGGTLRPHHGVEFDVPYNTEILSSASGMVVFAGTDDATIIGETNDFYGKAVVIEHDSRWNGQAVYSLYGHLNEIFVAEGQKVNVRQLLGLSGATGVADGPHLHFEVRVGSNQYANTRNPLLWLYPFEGRGTVAGYIGWQEGVPANGVSVTLHRIDAPTAQYYQTSSYAGTSINSDNELGENFVIDDVIAGYYQITIDTGDQKIKRDLWVFEYHTSFESFTLQSVDSAPVTLDN